MTAKIEEATIRENLRRAAVRGEVIAHDDGTWSLARHAAGTAYLIVNTRRSLGCTASFDFLFAQAYARAAVPYGCRACYKVKIVPGSLRELVALRDVLETVDCNSKCGVDFYNAHSQEFYAAYLYLDGLEETRAVYRMMRARLDADRRLGPAVSMTIKRGCSEFEVACGPSDRYEFPEEMAEIEAALRARFRSPPSSTADYRVRRASAMTTWIQFAFNIKDETYRDFTGGKRLYPPARTFPPEPAAPTEDPPAEA